MRVGMQNAPIARRRGSSAQVARSERARQHNASQQRDDDERDVDAGRVRARGGAGVEDAIECRTSTDGADGTPAEPENGDDPSRRHDGAGKRAEYAPAPSAAARRAGIAQLQARFWWCEVHGTIPCGPSAGRLLVAHSLQLGKPLAGDGLPGLHQFDKGVEQVRRIMRAGRGLGVVLHREDWQVPVAEAFDCFVVQVQVGDEYRRGRRATGRQQRSRGSGW